MRKETDTHIAGKLSIVLGAVFSLVAILLAILQLFGVIAGQLSVDLSLAFLITIITLLSGYVYGRIEHLADVQDRILAQPIQGIEIFYSAEALLMRLRELTVGASVVSTLNLSPPRGTTKPLDDYFKAVHAYLKSTRGIPLTSFRSIAHITDGAKARWVVARSLEFAPTGRFSQAVFDAQQAIVFPLGFHAIEKEGHFYVFFYPGVSLTGIMNCFLIKNRIIYEIMLGYFDLSWEKSVVIHEGANFRKSGLDKLAALAPELREDSVLSELAAHCNDSDK